MNENTAYESTLRPPETTDIPDATVHSEEILQPDATLQPDTPMSPEPTLKPENAALQPEPTLQTEATLQPETSSLPAPETLLPQMPQTFTLKGKTYSTLECISDTSGEAQVYLVSDGNERYVLKLYYAKFHIDKELLKRILNSDFEMVVKIFDFGKTYVDGQNRDYELMEYLRGGTLSKYTVNGDINKFRRIALQAAAALAFCHNYNIIHKDIKPSNFFFRDEEKTQIVLGDFGISSIEEGDSYVHSTTQARTPMYAAPEMYNNVIDGKVEITQAVDYFSLGITLMTIWTGSSPYGTNERLMMKMKNEGKLPGLDQLPQRARLIVEGLATSNPQTRWSYGQVEEWFKGGSPKVDRSSPFLNYQSFLVDPDRNLVAENIHELVPMLLDNERIAISYLYGGKIDEWLEHCGNLKLAMMVRDVVKRYSTDKAAGLMAAIYVMEPTYPYHDIHGSTQDDIHGVVASLIRYSEEYSMVLRNPNNRLWLYVESHTDCNVDRLRGYFNAKKIERDRWAVIRTCYELDPDLPLFPDYPSATLKEIVNSYGGGTMPEENWEAIVDGRLLSWMYSHVDPMACEQLRLLLDGKKYSKTLAYKVLYDIDRTAAYDLLDADTPQKVGEYMAKKLVEWQTMDNSMFTLQMEEFTDPEGRFAYYAQLHGWYELAGQASLCFDLESSENRDRLGVYDLRMAAYRFCRILGYTPIYKIGGSTMVASESDLDTTSSGSLKQELLRGYLAQWLAAFYHEDPTHDFSEQYAYERSLAAWIERLGTIDPSNVYYRRFAQAKKETAKKFEATMKTYRSMNIQMTSWSTLFYVLAAAWIVLLIVYGVGNHQMIINHSFYTIGLPVGVMSGAILGMRTYLRGNDFTLTGLWAISGVFSSLIPIQILKFVGRHFDTLFLPAIIALSLAYIAIAHFSDRRKSAKEHGKTLEGVLRDDVKSQLIEPLYYTFKTKSRNYKGAKFSLIDEVQDQFISDSSYRIFHFALWSIMLMLVIAELVVYSPQLMDSPLPSFFGGGA